MHDAFFSEFPLLEGPTSAVAKLRSTKAKANADKSQVELVAHSSG
jgi:hypothetical protein